MYNKTSGSLGTKSKEANKFIIPAILEVRMSGEHDHISVILVENIPQLQKHLQKTLGLIEDVDLENTVMAAQEALEVIRDLKPEVALIEYNLPDMNGINLTEILRKDFPETQIVLISQDNYTDIVLQAVRAGACDFITHEVSVKELTDVLHRAASLALQDRQKINAINEPAIPAAALSANKGANGRIVSVYSPKGGVGTTTVAANLALAVMDMDSDARVALVDGSMQYGDTHLLFNELGQLSVLDLVPRLFDLDLQLVESVMLLNRATGLYILPAPPRPEFAEKINGDQFTRILEFMRRYFDYIIINTDSFISDPVLAALDASEVVVLITAQQINAIRNTRLFLDLWDAFGMTRDRIGLIINRYDPNSPISVDKVGERLKFAVSVTLPDDPEVTAHADALGQPLLRTNKNSELAQAIMSLAEHVRKRSITVERSEEPRVRLFQFA
jgi:pilus assembly protein CpaE